MKSYTPRAIWLSPSSLPFEHPPCDLRQPGAKRSNVQGATTKLTGRLDPNVGGGAETDVAQGRLGTLNHVKKAEIILLNGPQAGERHAPQAQAALERREVVGEAIHHIR